MTAATTSVTTPSLADRARQWWRNSNIPPVYGFVVIIFLLSIVLDLLFGVDDQLFITNPVILTNVLVRSVALGIVAIGQTFVIIGASIDLSVAFMISVTAVGGSYLMAGDPVTRLVDSVGPAWRRRFGRPDQRLANHTV